eukprot:gene15608-17839_t
MAILSTTTLTVCGVVAFVAFIAQNLYKLANPLSGVEISGPTIDPLWPEHTTFDMLCYVSTGPSRKAINMTKIRDLGQVLYEERGLLYNAAQNLTDIKLLLTSPTSPADHITTQHWTDHIVVNTTKLAWQHLASNKTSVFLHVLLTRSGGSSSSREVINSKVFNSGEALHGVVGMVKYDKIPRSFRQRYLLSDFGWVNISTLEAERIAMPSDSIISYWKPEVSIKLVNDFSKYPIHHVPRAIHSNVVQQSSGTWKYKPSVFVDEMGLTSDKYVPLNASITALPLKISFGPLSLQRWLLMAQMEESLQAQTELGFTAQDLDDVRRLISETSVYMLGITLLASLLHLLFECLAFQSDISFWQQNKSLAGLSARTVLTDLISQVIVFLFLVDSDTSMLVTIPAGFGLLVQTWKVQKATGLSCKIGAWGLPVIYFSRWASEQEEEPASTEQTVAKTAQVEDEKEERDVATHTEMIGTNNESAEISPASTNAVTSRAEVEQRLTQVTLEADRFATTYLVALLLPVVFAFTARSLLYERHLTWYSWLIGASTSCVYTFGFVLMCPQLYINHKLKSVSHLPWKFLVFKFLNTFIDDLFAFIIKMPTMHRLSVFRDDIVFFIYLYQRHIYAVDENRPVEK